MGNVTSMVIVIRMESGVSFICLLSMSPTMVAFPLLAASAILLASLSFLYSRYCRVSRLLFAVL